MSRIYSALILLIILIIGSAAIVITIADGVGRDLSLIILITIGQSCGTYLIQQILIQAPPDEIPKVSQHRFVRPRVKAE